MKALHPAPTGPGFPPKSGFEPMAVGQGLLVGFLAALSGSVLLTLVQLMTGWVEIPRTALQSFNLLSIAMGGLYAGRKAGSRGWLNGALVGLVYFLVVTWVFSQGGLGGIPLVSGILMKGLLALALGALGGMLGRALGS